MWDVEHDSADTSAAPPGAELAGLAARLLGVAAGRVVLAPTPVGDRAAHLDAGAALSSLDLLVSLTRAPLAVSGAPDSDLLTTLLGVPTDYAGAFLGVPLIDSSGTTLGALSVVDPGPRPWALADVALLEQIARSVVTELTASTLRVQRADNQAVFAQAVEAAGIGTLVYDLTTEMVTCSEQLLALYEFPPGTTHRPVAQFMDAIHPEDRPGVAATVRNADGERIDYEIEYRLLLPGGTVRWLSTRGRVLRDATGRPVRLLAASHDISAVHDARVRLTRVLESMPAAFVSFDQDWRFTYANSESERLLGLDREQLLGGLLWELYPATVGSVYETNYRQAVATNTPVTFQAFYPAPLDAWYEVLAWPTTDGLSLYFLNITLRVAAQRLADQAADRWALLAQITEALLTSLDGDEAVGQLAPLLVPALADWCIVTVAEEDSRNGAPRGVRDVGSWHVDPAARPLVERYSTARRALLTLDSPFQEVLRTGQVWTGQLQDGASLLPPGEARDLFLTLAPHHLTVLPLRDRHHTVGLLTLFNGQARGPLTPNDLATAGEVADRAGMSLDNARLFAQQRQMAETLQRSLLSEPSSSPELAVAVRYRPAAEAARVGGDWYDAFTKTEGETLVVIGDVVGHDASAAAAMGQIRALLRGIAVRTGDSPAQILRGVDEVLATLEVDATATAVVARVQLDAGDGLAQLCWSNAGHPPPMLLLGDGTAQLLERPEADLMLGIDPGTARTESTVILPPGATVLLYTDGLVERRGESLDDGLHTLRDTLSRLTDLTADQLCDQVLHLLLPGQTEDDVALLAFGLRP